MAGRNVDALAALAGLTGLAGLDVLAGLAGQLALNEGPTLLGEGAFGKVYKETMAYGEEMMTVAVKKIENFNMEEAVKEVETLKNLNHKYIIKYYDHHFEDNEQRLCITMEFADKGTFTKLITDAAQKAGSIKFKEWNIWRTLSHLSSALDYLHTLPQPILHRDLKPDNILGVTNGGIDLKLADFGLVKLLDENAQGDFYAQTFCGTPTYMAPEVRNEPLNICVILICAGVEPQRLHLLSRHLVPRLHHGVLLQSGGAPFRSHKAGCDVRYGPEDEQVEGSSSGDHQRLLK